MPRTPFASSFAFYIAWHFNYLVPGSTVFEHHPALPACVRQILFPHTRTYARPYCGSLTGSQTCRAYLCTVRLCTRVTFHCFTVPRLDTIYYGEKNMRFPTRVYFTVLPKLPIPYPCLPLQCHLTLIA